MLTAKERHVRFVSRFLVCLRGLVVKADGTLVKPSLGQVRILRQFSFLHLRIGTRWDSNLQPQSCKTEASTTRLYGNPFISDHNYFYLIDFQCFGNKKKSIRPPPSPKDKLPCTCTTRNKACNAAGRFLVQRSTTNLQAAMHASSCKATCLFGLNQQCNGLDQLV